MDKRLNARLVSTIKTPGQYGDRSGCGLFLLVKSSGRKSYIQRISIRGKVHDIGLGSTRWTTLGEARKQAYENKRLVLSGGDPLDHKRKPDIPTLAEATESVIAIHEGSWKPGSKSADQWRASLRDYVFPLLGERRVSDISTADVMAALLPIWNDKHETAQRIRQRLSAIFKWCVVQGYRTDDPVQPTGAALPRNGKRRKHMAALPFQDVSAALSKVRNSGAYKITALCFEFLTLTATRSGECRLATWDEIDLEKKVWVVPAGRMKAKLAHRIPLSDRALEVLTQAKEFHDGSSLIFPSPTGRALSDSTLSKLCRDLKLGCVPHGMRSSFRQWAAEKTNVPREVCELALAHVNSDKTESAYQRSDLFEQRRELMKNWSNYIR